MKILKLVKNNVLSIFSKKIIVCTILVFISINYITHGLYNIYTLDEVIKLSFYGINRLSDPSIEIFKMLTINIIPIYITLNYFNVNSDRHNLFTVMRLKNKTLWINSLCISTFITCTFYYLIAFTVLLSLNFDLILVTFTLKYFFKVLVLLVLSSFSICLISMLLNSLIKNKSFIFSLIIFLHLLSVCVGDFITNSDKWLIFNQAMLIKHNYSNLTFYSACSLNIITSCILYFVIKIRILNKN